ncbi:MAG: phage portal protein [Tannerellaceae bacterium]|nr:phage portal protein [Tannerellaceae bacterium]
MRHLAFREADKPAVEDKGASKENTYTGSLLFDRWLMRRDRPMLLSTVYRCVELISSSVACLPLETYRVDADGFKELYRGHCAYDLLSLEPNEDMSRFVFLQQMVASVLLNGNGYAYIERNSRTLEVEQLIFIPAGNVSQVDVSGADGVLHRRYVVSPYRGRTFGDNGVVHPRDMIHVLNFSYDGMNGVSTISHARQTLEIASASESQAAGFFNGGGNMSGILKVEGTSSLPKEQKKQIYNVWEERIKNNPNGMVIIEGNMSYQQISVSPKDAQLLESRQYNVIDICRFFSVSPIKAFDLSKSSYSTQEYSNLAFLSETIHPYLEKIEQEINRKVFLPSERQYVRAEFNTTEFLRTDKKTQAEYHSKMFSIGAMTPNEVRRANNLRKIDGGDKAFVQINMQPLDGGAFGVKKEEIDVVREPVEGGKQKEA